MSEYYLEEGLPKPKASSLDSAYWEALQNDQLRLQYCQSCQKFQWGPEWICHRCRGEDLTFRQVETAGKVYSYERVWHPVHPVLKAQGPYIIVLVEMPQADGVRLVGNLLGDPQQVVSIGAEVRGVFEHHAGEDKFSLLHWELVR